MKKRKVDSSFSLPEQYGHQNKNKKSRSLPQQAKDILYKWLFSNEHFSDPFPSKEEKQELANRTGLTLNQINTWFTNARRRSWKTARNEFNRSASIKSPKAVMVSKCFDGFIQQTVPPLTPSPEDMIERLEKRNKQSKSPLVKRSTGAGAHFTHSMNYQSDFIRTTNHEKRTKNNPKVSPLSPLASSMFQSNSGNGLPWYDGRASYTPRPHYVTGKQYCFAAENSRPVRIDFRNQHAKTLCQGNWAASEYAYGSFSFDYKHTHKLRDNTRLPVEKRIVVFENTGRTPLPVVDIVQETNFPENRTQKAPRIPTSKQSKPVTLAVPADGSNTYKTTESTKYMKGLPTNQQSFLEFPISNKISEKDLKKKPKCSFDEIEWQEVFKTLKDQEKEHIHKTVESTKHMKGLPTNHQSSLEFPSSKMISEEDLMKKPKYSFDENEWKQVFNSLKDEEKETLVLSHEFNTSQICSSAKNYLSNGPLGKLSFPKTLQATSICMGTDGCQIENVIVDQNNNIENSGGISVNSPPSPVLEQQFREILQELAVPSPISKSQNDPTLGSGLFENGTLRNANISTPSSPVSVNMEG